MLSSAIRLAATLLLSAVPASAQVFDSDVYQPGDNIILTGPCHDTYMMRYTFGSSGGSTGLSCKRRRQIIEGTAPDYLTYGFEPMFAWIENPDEPGVPVDGVSVAYVINPVAEEPDTLSVSTGPYFGGTILNGTASAPEAGPGSGTFFSVVLRLPAAKGPGGLSLAAWSQEVTEFSQEDGQVDFSVPLPRWPGDYELLLLDEGGFAIARKEVVVELFVPELALDDIQDQTFQRNQPLGFGIDFATPMPSGWAATAFLLHEDIFGGWALERALATITSGPAGGNLTELSGAISDARPGKAGRYRVSVILEQAGSAERIIMDRVEFDVGPGVGQELPADVLIAPSAMVLEGEAVAIAAVIDHPDYKPPYSIEVYSVADPLSRDASGDWSLPDRSEPIVTLEVEPDSAAQLSSGLPEGVYAVLLRGTQFPFADTLRTLASNRLRVFPDGPWALDVAQPLVALGQPISVSARLPSPNWENDTRLMVSLHRRAGWIAGCTRVASTQSWGKLISEIGTEITINTAETLYTEGMRLPGEYEFRLTYGHTAKGFGATTNEPGVKVLAIAPFTILPQVGRLQMQAPSDKPLPTREQFEIALATDGAPFATFDELLPALNARVYRRPEQAVSGVETRGTRECVGGVRSVDGREAGLRTRCDAPGLYEGQTRMRVGCLLDYCPEVVVSRLPLVLHHQPLVNPAMQVVPEREGPRSLWGDWSEDSHCGTGNAEEPTLSFVKVTPPFDRIENVVRGYPFRIEARYQAPPSKQPDPATVSTAEGQTTSVPFGATSNPKVFLSEPVTLTALEP